MPASSHSQPHVQVARCRVCGRCIEICPHDVLAEAEGTVQAAHPERCDACLACEEACPENAIEVSFAIVWGEPSSDNAGQA